MAVGSKWKDFGVEEVRKQTVRADRATLVILCYVLVNGRELTSVVSSAQREEAQ
jgi:hypothetical protein